MSESPDSARNDFDGDGPIGACFIVYYGDPVHWAYIFAEKSVEQDVHAYFNGGPPPAELPDFVEVIESGKGERPPIEVQQRLYEERGITPIDNISRSPVERLCNWLGLAKPHN
jgi:hypothetical protein